MIETMKKRMIKNLFSMMIVLIAVISQYNLGNDFITFFYQTQPFLLVIKRLARFYSGFLQQSIIYST